MVFDEEHKNKVGKALASQIAESLRDGKITMEELPKVSAFILENIDKAKNHEGLTVFLSDLAKQWPAFQNILTMEKGEEKEEDVKKQAEELTQDIKNNNLN